MGVAWNTKRVSCRSALLYLAHWSACFMDFTHASQIYSIVGSEGLRSHVLIPREVQNSVNSALTY